MPEQNEQQSEVHEGFISSKILFYNRMNDVICQIEVIGSQKVKNRYIFTNFSLQEFLQ